MYVGSVRYHYKDKVVSVSANETADLDEDEVT